MNDTIEADVDAKGTDCPCCGDQMDRKGGRLCETCVREGCDPSTNLCHQDLIPDGGGYPEEVKDQMRVDDPQAIIETAADHYGVDLDEAITAIDPTEGSSRIYILDEMEDGYRLMEYGLEAGYPEEGQPAAEEPMHIPEAAISMVQSLLHGAGMHQAHNAVSDGDASLRDVSEGMGISEPYLGDQ